MSKIKVLITEVIHPILQEELEKKGCNCQHIEKITYEEVAEKIGSFEGLVVRSKIKVDRHLIDKAPHLRFIARAGSGMELIDTAYATSKGIHCISAPEGNKDAVGEQAVGMLLALLHNIVKSDKEVRQKKWDRLGNRGIELGGQTVGIIGYGNNGSAFAEKLKGFSVSLLAYDKYKKGFTTEQVEEVALETLFDKVDILSLHIPLTVETRRWINGAFIKKFRKPIYLINTSRGGILYTKEILQAVESGAIKGLALDVLENESFNTYSSEDWQWFDQLIQLPQVVLTSHIAGVTHDSFFKIGRVLAEKIVRIL